jgi:hypothetical protein
MRTRPDGVRKGPLGGKKLSTVQIQSDAQASKTLEIDTPFIHGIQFSNEIPQCEAMIPAIDLLQSHEKHAIKKIGGSFTIVANEKYNLVYPHQLVPQFATVLRSTTGSLIGFPCCKGG